MKNTNKNTMQNGKTIFALSKKLLSVVLLGTIIGYFLISCSDSDMSPGSGQGGSMARFTISGNHLYTVSESELQVWDISDNSKPERTSSQYMDGFVETIFSKDSLLFFGTRTGMLIYNNENPAQPSYMSNYAHIYSCDPVVVHKNIAFVTLNSGSLDCGRGVNMLEIIDLADLYNPKQIATHTMTSPKGLGIDGDVLFVCDGDALKSFHLDNFTDITPIGSFDVDAYDVIPDNGYLFMIGDQGLFQYKYTDQGIVKVSEILTEE